MAGLYILCHPVMPLQMGIKMFLSWCLSGDEVGLGSSHHEGKGNNFSGKKNPQNNENYFLQDSGPVSKDFYNFSTIFLENTVSTDCMHHFRAERSSGPSLSVPQNSNILSAPASIKIQNTAFLAAPFLR